MRRVGRENGTMVAIRWRVEEDSYWELVKKREKNVRAGSTKGDLVASWAIARQEEDLEISKDEICSSLLVESGKWFRGWPFLSVEN